MTDEELPHVNKKLDNPMEKWAKDMKRPFIEKEIYQKKKMHNVISNRDCKWLIPISERKTSQMKSLRFSSAGENMVRPVSGPVAVSIAVPLWKQFDTF